MTKHELRILYLLRKHGGQLKHTQLVNAMQRVTELDRYRALAALEDPLGLISSARRPQPANAGGVAGLVYWLTDVGNYAVGELIRTGDLKDPKKEPRAKNTSQV